MMRSDSRNAVLLAPCILSPGLQAEPKDGDHWGYPFIELLTQYRVNIVLLTCPEASFGGYVAGLRRDKHGIDYYRTLNGYTDYCTSLAQSEAEKVQSMHNGGYRFLFSLGIEHSPTCAVNYMYSHKGMLKRPGLFWELFQSELLIRGIQIPQIGINRTHINKSLSLVEQELMSLDKR